MTGNDYVAGMELEHSSNALHRLVYYITYTPIHFFWLGNGAVNFFFLLSGFVLASSLTGKTGVGNYVQYLIKRFFRLYLPFAIVILISIMLREVFYNNSDGINRYSDWLKGIWSHPIGLKEFWELITFKNRDFHNVVSTLWSIEVEIKMSIMVPLLLSFLALCKRFPVLKRVWHFAIWFAAFIITHNAGKDFSHTPVFDQFVMLHILPFVTGVLLFIYSPRLISAFERSTRFEVIIFLTMAILLYTNRWITHVLWDIPFWGPFYVFENDVLVLAGALFLMVSFNPHVQKFLSNKILIFTGKISYSLYLIHPIVLSSVVYGFGNQLPLPIVGSIIIALSIPISYLFYKTVENPLNNIGRLLAKRIRLKNSTVSESEPVVSPVISKQ
jgi:peptidoglycan/LPS O-acetylase OafA/YrhL